MRSRKFDGEHKVRPYFRKQGKPALGLSYKNNTSVRVRAGRLLLIVLTIAAGLVCSVAWSAPIPVQLKGPDDNSVCLGCHEDPALKKRFPDGRTISLYVDPEVFNETVHAVRTCTDCHTDIKQIPHGKTAERVNCGRCHYVEDIAGTRMPRKPAEYRESVHKAALATGNTKAPTCQNCHGSHDIFYPRDKRSSVYHANVPGTCGKCHIDIYSDYRESVHGEALARGNRDVPVCTDCHGEHSIKAVRNPLSSVYATKVPETCSKCHASQRIEDKYKLARERYETYRESYHGVANRFGTKTVANCASCHEAHAIRRSDDPKSSVNKRNLPHTCGKCHRGANENFARGKIHVIISKKEQSLLYYVSNGFKWLTIMTMIMLVGHIALDLMAKYRRRRG
ncbi:MAG: cytochrome c3 family protein [Armatimonadota bacterium]|nr:cytochrome c3 family protein [Armatimonadota bacterium]